MKKLAICLLAGLLLTACNGKKLELPADTNKDFGLNSSLTLVPGNNSFNTQDYILDYQNIDSVSVDTKGIIATLSEDKKTVALEVKGMANLVNISLWVEDTPYSIMAKRTDKIDFTFRYDPKGKSFNRVQLAGQMNDWVPDVNPDLSLNKDGIYEVTINVSPGTYLYQVVRDGEWNHDENNPEKVDNNSGKFNSILHIPSTQHLAPILLTKSFHTHSFDLEVLNEVGQTYVYWQNYKLPNHQFVKISKNKIRINIPTEAEELSRSYIRVITANKFGISNDVLVPLQNGRVLKNIKNLTRNDKYGEILYSLMVDRFLDADSTNNFPMNRPDVNPKVDYYGGDLKGITQKIKEGYFNKMGFTTIWISPIIQNPLEPYGGMKHPKTKFSGYHGYWPISSTKVDFRFGTSDDMVALTTAAHEKGLNVLLDYVANHVHEKHPMYQNDPTICTPLILPDGTKNLEQWNEHRLTTWFDVFLPTIDYSRPEIVEAMSDSAIYLIKEFGLDGFRHDACKHVPEPFWRTLTYKVKTEVELPEDKTFYQIGESYGSPQLISSYVNSGMLNGQFDFNVSDDAASVFALNSESFKRISNTLNTSLKVYGCHNLMGYITGNHDRARFISYASGDVSYAENSKAAGWEREIGLTDTTAYDKLIQLNAFNMTIPGVPVVYYGDEFGDPGANDPDCRRMMRFNDQLTKSEKRVRDAVAQLGQLRKNKLSLIYGDFIELKLTKNVWAYARNYFGETTIVIFNRNTEETEINVKLPISIKDKKFNTTFNSNFSIEDCKLSVTIKGNGVEVFTM